ncbi:hypothetical protein CTI12_AA185460 [Artemisia annua]|uniref:Zinc knuckle CX2CX4HX4C n=1 Tax=Artemisia annua TaxID=35608 RepID=A0A2U1P7G5_ARTAN|nr:hypothetical protein CTI12_AA185460 [Artemisia annua]
MDRMTTSICEKPYGRASFARVLVEIDSSKLLVDSVELWYESLGKVLKLWVEYSWVPPRCEECKIFGHRLSECARKVNTVQTVNKDGEKVANMKNGNSGKGVKDTDALNGSTGNGVNNVNMTDGDGGWQSVVNRRNVMSVMNNTRQGSFGDYNGRRVMNYNNRGVYVNKGNANVGSVGANDNKKKHGPVNSGNVGKLDDSIVANDAGESNNKGKGEVNESGSKDVSYNENVKSKKNNSSEGKADNNGNGSASKAGNASAGDKSVVNEKVKNRTVMTKVDTGTSSASKASNVLKDNVNNGGSHSGKTVETDKVETKNRFDILGKENESMNTDMWNEVKNQVKVACNIALPISEDAMTSWNDEMVAYYMVNWKQRTANRSSPEQRLKSKMESIKNKIVHLNRNIHNSAKSNAEKLLRNSVVITGDKMDVSFDKFYSKCYKEEVRLALL